MYSNLHILSRKLQDNSVSIVSNNNNSGGTTIVGGFPPPPPSFGTVGPHAAVNGNETVSIPNSSPHRARTLFSTRRRLPLPSTTQHNAGASMLRVAPPPLPSSYHYSSESSAHRRQGSPPTGGVRELPNSSGGNYTKDLSSIVQTTTNKLITNVKKDTQSILQMSNRAASRTHHHHHERHRSASNRVAPQQHLVVRTGSIIENAVVVSPRAQSGLAGPKLIKLAPRPEMSHHDSPSKTPPISISLADTQASTDDAHSTSHYSPQLETPRPSHYSESRMDSSNTTQATTFDSPPPPAIVVNNSDPSFNTGPAAVGLGSETFTESEFMYLSSLEPRLPKSWMVNSEMLNKSTYGRVSLKVPSVQKLVEVVVRCRPQSSAERKRGGQVCIEFAGGNKSYYRTVIMKSNTSREDEKFEFSFDKAFYWNVGQNDFYSMTARDYLKNVLTSKKNGLMIACGQTSSGKTYTMDGSEHQSQFHSPAQYHGVSEHKPIPQFAAVPDHSGVAPRLIYDILEAAAPPEFEIAMKTAGVTPHSTADNATLKRVSDYLFIEISIVEIYMEQPFDLLSRTPTREIRLRETPEHNVMWENLRSIPVGSFSEGVEVYEFGKRSRRMAETSLNARSSRSHLIVMFYFFVEPRIARITAQGSLWSKMYLVDLAGNEKSFKSNVTGVEFDEMKKINHSLTSLGMVMQSLSKRSSHKRRVNSSSSASDIHVPYRNSMLTRALQDALSGDNPVLLITAVSPSSVFRAETLATLRFAQLCQNIYVKTRHGKTKELTKEEHQNLVKKLIRGILARDAEIFQLRTQIQVALQT